MNELYNNLNQRIGHHMIIGMGSGTTIEGYIPSMASYIKQNGLKVTFVPTSKKTEKCLKQNNLITSLDISKIDFTIDGADQFNRSLQVVKGGGGSLLREKQIGYFSGHIIIVARNSKEVDSFENIKIPVEVNPFLFELTKLQIEALGASISDRIKEDHLFVTDNENYIADCIFPAINDLNLLQNCLLEIPGVVETGIFNRFIERIISFDDHDITTYMEG